MGSKRSLAHHPHRRGSSPAGVGDGGLVAFFCGNARTAQGTALGPSRGTASPLCPPTLSIMALGHGHYQLPGGCYPRPAPASKPTPCPGQDLVQSLRMRGRRVGAKACKITGRSEPNHSPSRGEPAGTEAWSRMSSPPLIAERARRRTSRLQRAQGRERGLFQSGSGQGGLLACAEAAPRGAGN